MRTQVHWSSDSCCRAVCRGGIGRAGMIAACVLLALDLASDADQAITQVRARRDPDAVQTSRQREYVSRFYKHLHSNE